jgi:hypothetical protein
MNRPPLEPADHPPLLRLLLFVGKPMGLTFVPEQHLRVINRMGHYAGVRGPGLMYHNRFTETLGPLVFTGRQAKEYELEDILSRDALPVTMTVSATIVYDPVAGKELASVLTRVPREAYVSIAHTYIRWELLAAANQYTATELTQHDVRAEIETQVRDRANEAMVFLGVRIVGKLRITRVQLPATLADRHATIAQRRANILAGTEFHPAEYRRALVAEVIEHLARSGGAESFLNFGEMLETYAAENRPAGPPRIIQQPPPSLEDKGNPPPAGHEPGPDTKPDQPPGQRRSRSRL